MNIVLINPPLTSKERLYKELSAIEINYPPLGLCYLASALREEGHEVNIIDLQIQEHGEQDIGRTGHPDTQLPGYPYTPTDHHLSTSVRSVLLNDPEVIGITSTTVAIQNAAEVAREIKKQRPDIPIILGGPHITAVPEKTMQMFPEFDVGVLGEGERTICELVSWYANTSKLVNSCASKLVKERTSTLNSIPGLIYRKGTNTNQHESKANERESEDKEISRGLAHSIRVDSCKLIKTTPRNPIKNLDELPLPAFDLLPNLTHYGGSQFIEFQNRPTFRLVTSRGCPFHCAFCDKSIFGKIFRAHSPKYIMEMVCNLYYNYGVRHIYFSDDTFTLDRERILELCKMLREFNEEKTERDLKVANVEKNGEVVNNINEVATFTSRQEEERNLKVATTETGRGLKAANQKLTWDCNTRVETIDQEMLKEMKKAGCTYIAYGIETGSQKILDNLNKGTTLAKIEETCQMTKNAGIKIRGNFIMGNPGATEETIKESIEFAKKLPLDTFKMSFFTPFPNTPLYEEIDKWGTYKEDWSKLSKYSPVFIPKDLTRDQMEKLYKRAYFEFYFRPKIIWKYLKQLNSWGAIESALKKVGILVRFLLGKKTPTLIHANNSTNKHESDSRHSGPDPESDGDDRQILNRVQNDEESNAQDDDKENSRGLAHFFRVDLRRFLEKFHPLITGVVSLIILGVIASKINFRETWVALKEANLWCLATAGTLSLVNNFLWITHKWKKVLEFLGSPLPYRKLLLPRVGGYPIHGILPAKTGEASRVAYLKKIIGVPVKRGTVSAVVTLILNLLALLNIAGMGLLVHQLIG